MKKDNLLKAVKQAILQEAIQGKLTENWRKENLDIEPASELLKRIKTEKEKLIKEKKIRKEKPLPPITEEEIPFELPQGWVWCRLGEIGITQTGTTPPKNNNSYYGDYIPFIQPSNITDSGLNFNCIYLSKKGIEKSRFIPKYSNLMVCIGGSAGKTCYNEIDITCNQQINTITGLSEINYKFLDIVLKSPHFFNSVWDTIKQGSTPILNKGNWSKIIIPICSIIEQKTIVKKVKKLFEQAEAISKGASPDDSEVVNKKAHQLLKNYSIIKNILDEISKQKKYVTTLKQSILQEAIQGKLTEDWRKENPDVESANELLKRIKAEKDRLIKEKKIRKEKPLPPITEEEIPFELPEGWVWCRIIKLFKVLSTNGKQIKNKDYLDKGNLPIIDQGKKLIGGYSNDRSKLIEIKKPIIIFGDHTKEIKFIDFNFIPGADGTKLLDFYKPQYVKFIFYLLKAIKLENRGYSRHFKILKQQIIPLPPLTEQKAIVKKVESLMQKVSAMEEEIQKSEQNAQMLMQAVLKEAFEGKKEEVEV